MVIGGNNAAVKIRARDLRRKKTAALILKYVLDENLKATLRSA